MDRNYAVDRLVAELPAAEYCARFVDIPRMHSYCRQCPNFGAVWSCPPYDFDLEQLWQRFRRLRLLGLKLVFFPELLARTYAADELDRLLHDALYREREQLESELFALEVANPGSLALLPGSCRRCGEGNCTRPQPCRHPQLVRYSLEAIGGDVSRTAEELLATPLLWPDAGRLPEYLTLMAALLLP